ncbi:hypothetical protein PG993_004262 [Apiospora rasikravindrae]|uniref:BTB domain-containing protein n=1 Tax=Apiospora rasikravindrae TaxID=990691 RepID=A0ABR1TEZ6_9PEZI
MSSSMPQNESRNEAQKAGVSRDERLFKTGEYADLRVICGVREWNLHRNILASRCEWFDKAIGGNSKEAHTQEIAIQEFDPSDIQLLLEYIYTGSVDLKAKKGASLIDICIRFYDLADFFLLPKLQESCIIQFRNYNARKCAPLQNQYWVQDIDNLGAILYDLRTAYGQKTPAGDVFRGLMKTLVHETRYRFFRCQPFISPPRRGPRAGGRRAHRHDPQRRVHAPHVPRGLFLLRRAQTGHAAPFAHHHIQHEQDVHGVPTVR